MSLLIYYFHVGTLQKESDFLDIISINIRDYFIGSTRMEPQFNFHLPEVVLCIPFEALIACK